LFLSGFTPSTTVIVAFGCNKSLTNLTDGPLTDRVGRNPILLAD